MKKLFGIIIGCIGFGFVVLVSLGRVYAIGDEALNDWKMPEIYIKAINPGYAIDGKNNVGEMIEIGRRKSDEMISLAGVAVGYTNSSGNYSIIFEFPENSFFVGETLLLRLASSPESELAAVNYSKTLAFTASIDLKKGQELLDAVCWTGKKECYKEFKSSDPTSLVRELGTGNFEHRYDYVPSYDEKSYFVQNAEEEKKPRQCNGLIFSEILSYYDNTRDEQFVEIYNSASEQILMNGCSIGYKNKMYELEGILGPEKYHVYYPKQFSLVKNPTNFGALELVDANGDVLDKLEYPNGQRRGTSYALIGFDGSGGEIWKTTYRPTPGEENDFQQFKTCEQGKVINEATGNCVKVTNVVEKICKEGEYLNIITGRCKKVETISEKTCKEGYELNPETGRCRKIKNNDGAKYDLKPENYEESSSFVAMYAVLGVIGLGLVYVVFEFRQEIVKIFGKVFRRFHRTRRRGTDRH